MLAKEKECKGAKANVVSRCGFGVVEGVAEDVEEDDVAGAKE